MLTDAVCFLSGASRVLYFHHITVSGWWRLEPTTQGPHFLSLGFASRQTGVVLGQSHKLPSVAGTFGGGGGISLF